MIYWNPDHDYTRDVLKSTVAPHRQVGNRYASLSLTRQWWAKARALFISPDTGGNK